MRGLNENVPIQDIFCSGIGAIERLEGNCLRFYLYVSQTGDDGEVKDKLVVAKIIAPASVIPEAVMQMLAAIGERAIGIVPAIGDLVH